MSRRIRVTEPPRILRDHGLAPDSAGVWLYLRCLLEDLRYWHSAQSHNARRQIGLNLPGIRRSLSSADGRCFPGDDGRLDDRAALVYLPRQYDIYVRAIDA